MSFPVDNRVRWLLEQQAEALDALASYLRRWMEPEIPLAVSEAADVIRRALSAAGQGGEQ